jgi:hypothetical protein
MTIGTTLDDEGCYGWLDQQILGSQQASALQGALGTLGAIGAATGSSYGAGAAAGAGALSALIGNAQANSPVGNDPVAAYGLVVKQRLAWQAAASTPMTREDAFAFVASYHRLCSLGGIRLAMHMAAMTAPVSVAQPPQGILPSYGRVLPPEIIVGTPPPPVQGAEHRRRVEAEQPARIRRQAPSSQLQRDPPDPNSDLRQRAAEAWISRAIDAGGRQEAAVPAAAPVPPFGAERRTQEPSPSIPETVSIVKRQGFWRR